MPRSLASTFPPSTVNDQACSSILASRKGWMALAQWSEVYIVRACFSPVCWALVHVKALCLPDAHIDTPNALNQSPSEGQLEPEWLGVSLSSIYMRGYFQGAAAITLELIISGR